MNKLNLKRIGKFQISRDLFRNFTIEDLNKIFKDVFIVNVEAKEFDILEYTAISPYFEEIEKGYVVPVYTCEITRNDADNYSEVNWSLYARY